MMMFLLMESTEGEVTFSDTCPETHWGQGDVRAFPLPLLSANVVKIWFIAFNMEDFTLHLSLGLLSLGWY